jgi:PAS domain-containing protein
MPYFHPSPQGRLTGPRPGPLCYNPPTSNESDTVGENFADGFLMQDTASSVSVPVAPLATRDDIPALAFADADGAKRWAKSLMITGVTPLYEAVHGQLRALSRAEFAPRERATIAEVMREQVAHLHTELARRYAGKPQPAADRELEAAEQALALWQALWEQYSTCLKPLLEGDIELQGVKAKLLQRGLYVGKQLVLVNGLARRVAPGALWQELHAYYRLAEMLDCAVTAVSDDLQPHAVGISCYSTYCHALLLGLADPCAMSVRQIELTDRWLGQWARKIFPYAQQRETEGPVMLLDLDSAVGAWLAATAPRSGAPAMRYGYPGKLATSVRGRLKRLSGGASPAELQLGHDTSTEGSVALLSHLDAHWYQLGKQDAEAAQRELQLAAGGIQAAYFRVGGRTFDRQDPLGRMTFQGAQHLQTLGALTDYDRYKEEAERNWPWERWQGQYESNEARLLRRDGTRYRWFLDQLVVVRVEDKTRLGYIVRVAFAAPNELAISVRLWAGSPKSVAARPISIAFAEELPLAGLLLAASGDEPATLVVPPRTFNPGRLLRSVDPGPERKYRLTRLVQRGGDFERVTFEDS